MSNYTATITYADSTTKVVIGTFPTTDADAVPEIAGGIKRKIAAGKLPALVAPYTVTIVVT